MNTSKAILLACFLFLFAARISAIEGIAKANGIDIWYETFGEQEQPPLLLIMGGCCQGILWPSEFCEKLAEQGFYVVRYDHRDTGFSTCFDFEENPYDLLDMAKDAIGLLDALEIKKVHLLGLSMGGPISELMAVDYPERVLTITLMATSCDFRPMNLAYRGLPAEEGSLSRTKEIYLTWMWNFLAGPPKNQEEALEQRMACWRILNGTVIPFEEDRYRELHQQFLLRSKNPESIKNHVLVCKNSEDLVKTVPSEVQVPTLVIHGTEDPILPPDHWEALAKAIRGSEYLLLHGMGHVPNCYFYDAVIQAIKKNSAHCF